MMRLLVDQGDGSLSLAEYYDDNIPRYAILSHTWGADSEEVTFKDLTEGTSINKTGYRKLEFCRKQAANDGLQHFWVDTCCIDKSSSAELTEAINSMFRWYKNASICYVYLSDFSTYNCSKNIHTSPNLTVAAFRRSRWFSRGWTLQELIAPTAVEFFSREEDRIGSRMSLEKEIHEITGICIGALRGEPMVGFEVEERLSWADYRETKRQEDKAYSLLGIFDIYMPLLYGEGRENAFVRLRSKIEKSSKRKQDSCVKATSFNQLVEGASFTINRSDSRIALPIAQLLDNSIQLMVVGKGDRVKSMKWNLKATGYILPESAAGTFEEQPSYSISSTYSNLESAVDDMAVTWKSMKRVSDTLKSFVQKTQDVFMSEDHSLRQHLARIYRDLGRTGGQIQQLKGLVDQFKDLEKDGRIAASHDRITTMKDMASYSEWDSAEESDRSAIDVFFDCVSRFSSDDGSASIDNLYLSFAGSLDRQFKSETPFYPEKYTLQGVFSDRVFAVAMKQSTEDIRTMTYFLTYAETPRRWQRVIVTATFYRPRERSYNTPINMTENVEYRCLLSVTVQNLLRTLISHIKLPYSVSKLCATFREDTDGDFIVDSDQIEVTEDDLKVQISDEKKFLEYIDATNCAQFVESDVVVDQKVRSYCYSVYFNSQQCHERKVPFARIGRPGENAFQDFLDEIKLHIALRDCRSVANFVGIVLDDTRQHLRSYLLEYPPLINMKAILGEANTRSDTIPWPLREAWARQMINAVVDIHSKGAVLGAVRFNWFGVRADGTAVLVFLNGSQSDIEKRGGQMPPELRDLPQSDCIALRKNMVNFQTDIFQLGLILWLLVEHKPLGFGYFCALSACTHYPRYTCTAIHSDPVELPTISARYPLYLREIINSCRSPDPSTRISARELARAIDNTAHPETRTIDISKLLRTYATDRDTEHVYCNECRFLTTENYFNCNICSGGDFDICPGCYAQNIRCCSAQHSMIHWKMKNGRFVDEP